MVRHKNRYMVVNVNLINVEELQLLDINEANLSSHILNKIQTLHGDFGVAAVRQGFQAKYCNKMTKIAVIRARHGPHTLVTSTLPFINKLDGKQVTINILYVGATIRHAFKFIKDYQQKKFDKYCVNIKSDSEKQQLKDVILNFEAQLKAFQG